MVVLLLCGQVVALCQLAPTTRGTIVREPLDPGVIRFFADERSKEAAEVSYAVLNPSPLREFANNDFPIRPIFRISQGKQIVTILIEDNTSLYGTGMVVGPLLRNGQIVQTWNTDSYGYGSGTQNLYQSHPWVLAVRPNGSSFGVLADTTHRCTIDTMSAITFICPPSFPVIVIDRPSPQEVVQELAKLTGYMPLPPKWALGYHQSKYSYYPASQVLEIAKKFRASSIPCDAVWIDIDYMDQYRIFSFSPQGFPDPKHLNERLRAIGFHSVWMIDPGVKRESTSGVTRIYDSGVSNDVWVKRVDGTPYVGRVWPEAVVFPDFLNPAVRHWWSGFFKELVRLGVSGVWNDMNEPALFNESTKTMPESNVHHGDPTLLDDAGYEQGTSKAIGDHERYHNVYGMMMARATYEGLLAAAPDRRPFVLSRANFIGGQRYAASWTGDNTASWQHLAFTIPMVLNLGLSGQPFAGPDIGGYLYDNTSKPSKEEEGNLFARWIGIGALLPFSRGHYNKGYPWSKEPWSFNDQTTRTSRIALQRRYRLMPYLYTAFEEASRIGLPIARPLFFADPKDLRLRAVDDAFLLGQDIIVAAQVRPGRQHSSILPLGTWEKLAFPETDTENSPADDENADLPRLYIRGGAIVPSGPLMQYVDEKRLDPLTLLVCLDKNGDAAGSLYEDSGEGFDYLAFDKIGNPGKSQYLRTSFKAHRDGQHVKVTVVNRDGKITFQRRNIKVRLFADNAEFDAEGSDEAAIVLSLAGK